MNAAKKGNMNDSMTQGKGMKVQKLPMQVRKLQDAPQRLLTEVDIEAIYDKLSEKGKRQVTEFVNLPCGRGG